MTCHYCKNTCKRFGKHRNGLQHFRCRQCKRTFTEEHEKPLDEMRLQTDRAVSILQLLLEGMSVRSVERVTNVHRSMVAVPGSWNQSGFDVFTFVPFSEASEFSKPATTISAHFISASSDC